VDTTVHEKAIAHPRSRSELPKRDGVELPGAICAWPSEPCDGGRYTHAHQFKRARRELKFRGTRLGRITRYIRRKIEGNIGLENRFGALLDRAADSPSGSTPARAKALLRSLHAPEVECIGRGKARSAYEFGLQGLHWHAGHRPRA
jgi:IS5 family transposase